MNLIKALQQQMKFCREYSGYQCGVFVRDKNKKQIVMDIISNILPRPNGGISLWCSNCEAKAVFPNGSIVRILLTETTIRDMRYNGLIIDNDIPNDLAQNFADISYWAWIEQDFSENTTQKAIGGVSYVDISGDDIEQSKRHIRFLTLEELNKYIKTVAEINMEKNKKFFRMEYECMFETNNYDHAIVDKELNGTRVLLYEAWGIPKNRITYETEFINKTKQAYLNIKGEYGIEDLGFENDLNVHLLIDTDVYDGYEVKVEDGMVTVELHEIENEKPELKDLSVEWK